MSDTVEELVKDDQVFGGGGDNSICTSITYDLSYLLFMNKVCYTKN